MTDKRSELVEGALAYVLDHGVTGLSLRPLATALGTSDRMLIFYFGSKAQLVQQVLERASARLGEVTIGAMDPPPRTRAALVRQLWRALGGEPAQPIIRLFFELLGPAMREVEPYAYIARTVLRDWVDLTGALLRDVAPDSTADDALYVVATLEGLLICRGVLGTAIPADGVIDLLADRPPGDLGRARR